MIEVKRRDLKLHFILFIYWHFMRLVLYPPTWINADVNFELEHQAQNNYRLKVRVPQVPTYKIHYVRLFLDLILFFCVFIRFFVASVYHLAAGMRIFGLKLRKDFGVHLKLNEYNNNINLALWSSTVSILMNIYIYETVYNGFIAIFFLLLSLSFSLSRYLIWLLFWCDNKCANDRNIWWLVVCCFPWSV